MDYKLPGYGHFSKTSVHIILIILIGLLCYSNTFNAPFQWDEPVFIVKNPIVRDLGYFLEPSRAEGHELYSTLSNRYVGFLSFALNYKLHGFNVTGYHIVNITIHIINSLLVYLLVVLTFKTPFFKAYHSPLFARGNGPIDDNAFTMNSMIAFFTALIFVSHPLQTEAVTYIFQRLASLVTMFYLGSLVMYIKFRALERPDRDSSFRSRLGSAGWYLGAVFFAVLAMKTKENAFTLPLMIAAYELSFFHGRIWKRTLQLAPIILTLLIIPLTLTGIDKPADEIIGNMADAARGDADISRLDYLYTQFRVIVTYIRLIFLPLGQNLSYDYPISSSFFQPTVLLSFLFLSSILASGVYLFYRSRSRLTSGPQSPALGYRLISFGIFWFFMTLSVESSVVPLSMTICEYRVYLPSVGAFLGLATAAFLFLERTKSKQARTVIVLILITIPFLFASLTYARNILWESKISLWKDVASKSPLKARSYYNLGNAYYYDAQFDAAIEQYRTALILNPDYAEVYNNLGDAYGSKGLTDLAMESYQKALDLNRDYAEAHFNLGLLYFDKGNAGQARAEFETAVKLKPNYEKARMFLGYVSRFLQSSAQ